MVGYKMGSNILKKLLLTHNSPEPVDPSLVPSGHEDTAASQNIQLNILHAGPQTPLAGVCWSLLECELNFLSTDVGMRGHRQANVPVCLYKVLWLNRAEASPPKPVSG